MFTNLAKSLFMMLNSNKAIEGNCSSCDRKLRYPQLLPTNQASFPEYSVEVYEKYYKIVQATTYRKKKKKKIRKSYVIRKLKKNVKKFQ